MKNNQEKDELSLANKFIDAAMADLFEIEQVLGAALHYPRYCDDQVAFPGATEEDGVCVGEHTTVTIAQEAAKKIASLENQLSTLASDYRKLATIAQENITEVERLVSTMFGCK